MEFIYPALMAFTIVFLSELGDTDKFVDIVTKEVSLDILYNEVRKNAIHNITE